MEKTIEWTEAAAGLKREVHAHGGFLTLQRDVLRERFGIGRLTEKNTDELVATLDQHRMIVHPHPYAQGTSLRVYDAESEIGKTALAVLDPQNVSERALVDAVNLHARANAGIDRRSDDVPWLLALDVFLQLVIGRPPEGWVGRPRGRSRALPARRRSRREPRIADPCSAVQRDGAHRRRGVRVPRAGFSVGGCSARSRRGACGGRAEAERHLRRSPPRGGQAPARRGRDPVA